MLHLCSIQEIFAHFNHQFKDRPECAQAIQNKTHELLENLLEYFESEDKPQDIAMSQMRYQNSGRPWIDSGRADYDEESDQFADTRLLTQVWLVLDQDKEVLYWTRVAYTDRHIAYLKSKWPNWGKGIDDRRPMGPYLVECSSASGSVSTVQMEQDWTSPVFTPIGKGFGEARVACRSAGFRTTW
jgi:hypothetical protein